MAVKLFALNMACYDCAHRCTPLATRACGFLFVDDIRPKIGQDKLCPRRSEAHTHNGQIFLGMSVDKSNAGDNPFGMIDGAVRSRITCTFVVQPLSRCGRNSGRLDDAHCVTPLCYPVECSVRYAGSGDSSCLSAVCVGVGVRVHCSFRGLGRAMPQCNELWYNRPTVTRHSFLFVCLTSHDIYHQSTRTNTLVYRTHTILLSH